MRETPQTHHHLVFISPTAVLKDPQYLDENFPNTFNLETQTEHQVLILVLQPDGDGLFHFHKTVRADLLLFLLCVFCSYKSGRLRLWTSQKRWATRWERLDLSLTCLRNGFRIHEIKWVWEWGAPILINDFVMTRWSGHVSGYFWLCSVRLDPHV